MPRFAAVLAVPVVLAVLVVATRFAPAEDPSPKPSVVRLQEADKSLGAAAFSADGTRLAGSLKDGALLRVWSAADGAVVCSLECPGGVSTAPAFSPDGRRLAVGCKDGSVKAWALESGKLLLDLKGHEPRVVTVAFSPDGKRIATGTLERVMIAVEGQSTDAPHSLGKIWDAATGKAAGDLEEDPEVREAPTAIAWSGDSSRVAMQRGTCSLQVYAAGDTPSRVWTLPKDERAAILALHVAADGSAVRVVVEGGLVRTWALPKK